MTEEQQRITIAEACGWTRCEGSMGYETRYRGTPSETTVRVLLPDYLNDLNAMHEAETHLLRMDTNCGYWECYSNSLITMLGCSDIFHATATQRAEAFLRTIRKWEEPK